jgi:hypothetical protein
MRLAEAAEVDAMWSFVERSAPGWLEKSCLLTFSIRLYDSSPYLHRGSRGRLCPIGQGLGRRANKLTTLAYPVAGVD